MKYDAVNSVMKLDGLCFYPNSFTVTYRDPMGSLNSWRVNAYVNNMTNYPKMIQKIIIYT